MKRLLLVALVLFTVSGTAWAQKTLPVDVSGYMAPNFRIIDNGEGTKSDVGFGLAFNRITFSGMVDVGPVVKRIGWKVETDVPMNGEIDLIYAYVHAYFNEAMSARFGHVKEAFGREWLHPTYGLLTADRLITPIAASEGLNYFGYSYGLELLLKQEMFSFVAGAYDGQGNESFVGNQDPDLDYGVRALVKPVPELEIGGSVQLKSLPGVFDTLAEEWFFAPDEGVYPDDEALFQTNSAMAWEVDADYQKAFNPQTSLWLQGEFGGGDNYGAGPKETDGNQWEDFEWFTFQYFYVKALLMATPHFGVHFGYAHWDPNTDEDDDAIQKIVPGITYRWSDFTRTQAEVQLVKEQFGDEDEDFTNIVVQQVLVW